MNSLLSTSKTFLILLLFLSTTVIFHSCIKDQGFFDNNLIPIGQEDNLFTDMPKEVVITNIFGSVVDENDHPIANSEISLNTLRGVRTTTTDEYGNFLYTKVMVTKNNTLLKVRQSGKFEAFRKMNVTADSYNYTKIKLLDKNIAGSISAMNGGIIEHSSTAKVELPNNGIRSESGENYTGNVEVAMSWLDPTAEDLVSRMIGDLSGIDEDGNQVALGTFGMLNVELLGENGEELQLKEGMPATLTFPVPAEILAQAPPTIPLWSFDEDLGTWVEEGFATLQGDAYVGEVAHFSSWNVDTKTNPISVSGNVFARVNEEDIVVPYLQVFVDIEGVRRVGGFLDDSGEFEFYNFPANTVFTLSILDACGGILLETELGPYASDTDLGTIVILAPENSFVTISGSGVDCDGNMLTSGHVKIILNDVGFLFPLEEGGTFEFVMNVCDEIEGEINVTDLANSKISFPQVINVLQETVNVGLLTACDELESYIEVNVEGEESLFFDEASVSFKVIGGEVNMRIEGGNIEENSFILNTPNVTQTGVYENAEVTVVYGVMFYVSYSLINVEITEYGEDTGSIIKGAFEGQVYRIFDTSSLVPLSGSFKVIRQ